MISTIRRTPCRHSFARAIVAAALVSAVLPASALADGVDDVFATAPVISGNTVISDTLTVAGDLQDVRRVTLQPDEVLTLTLSGTPFRDFDLALYGPGATSKDDVSVVESTNTGTASESLSFLVPPGAGGEYFVRVYCAAPDATGSYTLVSTLGAPEVARLSGSTRYATSLAISRSSFATATAAVIASGDSFPDALAASGLAGAVRGPIILVPRITSTDDARLIPIEYEIERLGVSTVYIVGGTGALSSAVETVFTARVALVKRVGGLNRYETSARIAEEILKLPAPAGGRPDVAFVVRGDEFADALAVAPYAYSKALPVLLTKSTSLSAETSGFITSKSVGQVVVAGGEGAVSAGVYAALDALRGGVVTVHREGGANRFETATMMAGYCVGQGWGTWDRVGIATGLNFPDALSGGAACGIRGGGALLLTRPTSLSPETQSALEGNGTISSVGIVFGGTGAVSEAVRTAVGAALPD